MIYIIGFGVLTLITLRIVQAELDALPRARRAVTVVAAVAGIGFIVWLAVQWYVYAGPLPEVPRTP